MRFLALVFVVMISFNSYSQTQETVTIPVDYSLAKVGVRIYGVYVFFMAEPYFDYDYIETIKTKITWSGSAHDSFEKIIKKAQKKHTNFNGIIFHSNNLDEADLIRFKEAELTKAGFKIGDYVSFIVYGEQYQGEIIELGAQQKKMSIKVYRNGVSEIMKVDDQDLTKIDELDSKFKPSDAYTKESVDDVFVVGDRVVWVHGSKTYSGVITEVKSDELKVKPDGAPTTRIIKISEAQKEKK